MVDHEKIARRALEIAEELRRALPPNTDFADGWQQRYLDRQNERFEKALEMARQEATGSAALRYDGLHEYAERNRLDYNELCRVVRDACGVGADHHQVPTPSDADASKDRP